MTVPAQGVEIYFKDVEMIGRKWPQRVHETSVVTIPAGAGFSGDFEIGRFVV
jgi:hypothetical protein